MGRVWRARHTGLNRDDALKVLPESFAADPERLARFQREAQLLASLNHPNIAHVFGLENVDGTKALVMELVEGPTLADRIARGPLGIDEALRIAKQIADALEIAHEQRIVHRDLKPANVKVRADGTVKVLDFGLAKAIGGDAEDVDLTQVPTMTVDHTRDGLIVGTPAYMSPEQARGLPVDKRTDTWAFGCVLYEMLTRRPAFQRDTVADTLAAVVQSETDWSYLPANIPSGVRRLLRRCLEKDPKRRLRDIGDARLDLDAEADDVRLNFAAVGTTAVRTRRSIVIAAAGILAAALGIASLWMLPQFRSPAPVHSLRVSVNPPPGGEFRLESGSEISPNGRLIVYVAHTGDADRLWLRPLDELSARELPGTEGATFPFWSPDSRSIGFFAAGKLKRIDVGGGSPIELCAVTGGRGGTWSANGVILFNGYNDGPILQVSASGGEPVAVTNIDQSRSENSHRWPQFLPDGRRFLYFVRADNPQVRGVYVSALDRPTEKTRLLGSTAAWYAPGRDGQGGYLFWVRDDHLVAQPFDAATAQLVDDAVPIATGPFAAANFREFFSASTDGTLLYEKAAGRKVQLTWYGRDGKATSVVGQPDTFVGEPRLSPDGKQIAVIRASSPAGLGQVSIIETDRGVAAPFAGRESGGMTAMAWARDNKAVAYSLGAPPNLYVKSTDGTERRLTTTRTTQTVWDWSPDGRYLLYTALSNELSPTTRYDLAAWPLNHGEPQQLTRGTSREIDGRFSPDGRWITYTSDESGRNEIYVQRFPDGRTKKPVSTRGGSHATWRGDGGEIFYRSLDGTLVSVTVRLSASAPELDSPVPLFKLPPPLASASGAGGYDASADGQHFLAFVSVETGEASPMIVVTNWQADLAAARAR